MLSKHVPENREPSNESDEQNIGTNLTFNYTTPNHARNMMTIGSSDDLVGQK